MEFKFRAKDGQPSAPPPQYSSFTYFTEQAIRAGYANNNNYGPPRPNDFFRNNHNDMRREAIQRELEKERIREEIIASEIARKRVLEAEVRRELMMEREMALRRASGGDGGSFAFLSHRFEPLPHRLPILPDGSGGVRSFEEQIVSSLQDRIGLGTGPHSRRETGGLEMVPFQRHTESQIAEIKAVPEVNKEKVILLGKPNTNITGVKRKSLTPPAAGTSDLPLNGSKKQPKVEWSCAVCQVSATNKRGLNEHLGGKKHKSKEAAMRAQKTGKNFGIGLFPKKTVMPIKLAETTANPSSVEGIMIDKKSPMLKKKPVLHMKKGRDDPKTGDEDMGESKKKKFRFWCDMCQAGAFSEKVMNHHRRGKKHVGRLLVLEQNNGAASRTPTAKHLVEDAKEESKKIESDVVAIEETTDTKVKVETASGTPSAKHSEEAAEEESKKIELDVVAIEETTDTTVKVETASGTPSAKHSEEATGEESKKMESNVVAIEETTDTKVKVEIPLEVRDVAPEKVDGVEMTPHQGSKEVADIGGMD